MYEPPDIRIDESGTRYVVYEVDRIVGHRSVGRGRRRYVNELAVRFVGFGPEFDRRYEDVDIDDLIETAPRVVNQYLRDVGEVLAPRRERRLRDRCDEENEE